MIEAVLYQASFKAAWDAFVEQSKNGTFMLKRDYAEYHADRFTDCSLLFFEGQKLLALLPASLHGDKVISHGGLTYGGLVADRAMTAQTMLRVMSSMIECFRDRGISEISYKRIPSVYYTYPSDEDLYALFRYDAVLTKRGLSSAIYLPDRLRYSKGRRSTIVKAARSGVTFAQSEDLPAFVELLTEVLQQRHACKPVHSAGELAVLKSRFPDNIKLYTAVREGRLLAGALMYETPLVAHTQYLANSEEGRSCGALDFLIDRLITEVYPDKLFFDFGISTEDGGRYLNEGLIGQKQEFGARGIVYDEYLIKI